MCRNSSPMLGDQACNSRLAVRPHLLSSTPHKLARQLQRHSGHHKVQRYQLDQPLNPTSSRAAQHINVGYQLANSAAAVVATVALLISPVGLSASKRPAVSPTPIEALPGSSMQYGSTLAPSAAFISSGSSTSSTASLECAADPQPLGQLVVMVRQVALLAEDLIYLSGQAFQQTKPHKKHCDNGHQWSWQQLAPRIQTRLLLLFGVVLLGYSVLIMLGACAPWASQPAAAPVAALIVSQWLLGRMPAKGGSRALQSQGLHLGGPSEAHAASLVHASC